jgi:hypothetical protein
MENIRIICAVLTLALALLGCTRSPSLPQPRNDGNDWNGGWSNIAPDNHMRQTFASAQESVRVIEVAVLTVNTNRLDASDTLTLTLLDEHGTTLSSVSKRVSSGQDGWLEFVLPQETKVERGQKLVIELSDTGQVLFGWKYSGDQYPNGERVMFKDKSDYRTDWLFRVK